MDSSSGALCEIKRPEKRVPGHWVGGMADTGVDSPQEGVKGSSNQSRMAWKLRSPGNPFIAQRGSQGTWCDDRFRSPPRGSSEGQIRKKAWTEKQEEELQVEELRRTLWLEARTQMSGSGLCASDVFSRWVPTASTFHGPVLVLLSQSKAMLLGDPLRNWKGICLSSLALGRTCKS